MAHVPSHHTAATAAAVQIPQVPMNNNNTPIASSSSITNPRSRPNANNRLTSDHPTTSSTYTQSLI
jgi:hypothetical protein